MDNKFWFSYTYKKVKAMNRVLNFVVGARGIGKTYAFKKDAVEQFLKDGSQFIYMRRYEKELLDKKARELFWPLALREEFPEHDFSFKDGCYCIDGQIAGFPMALSTAGQMKSIEYDRVKTVCFDEFLIQKTQYSYLSEEVTLFNEAVITISRLRFVQFFLLSNAISWNNPYFIRFRIARPKAGEEISKTKSYTLTVPNSDKYRSTAITSPAGLVFQELDPEFFGYAYENQIMSDCNDFIEHKTGDCRYICTIHYDSQILGIWQSVSTSRMYVSPNTDPSAFFTFVLRREDMRPGMQFDKRNPVLSTVAKTFKQGCLYYENLDVKATFYDMMRYII